MNNNIQNIKVDKDWMDAENWKEILMDYASKFIERTGRQKPTYEEVLSLDKDEFKAWVFIKASKHNQEETLKEMIEHENKTGSFAKTMKEDDASHIKALYDVFVGSEKRSRDVVSLLQKIEDVKLKYLTSSSGDLVGQLIWAKATSDYYKLL